MTTATLAKGDKVQITNIAGQTEPHPEPNYNLIGVDAYIHNVYDGDTDWVEVQVPTHRYYAKPNHLLVRRDEIKVLEEAHPPTNES